jgi:DNA (cytosine-5)-methyltransferase 1
MDFKKRLIEELNLCTITAKTHGSLFSGIGGFDLAAQWMGWENVFHCEWNDFGKQVLNYYWPQAISYDDITKTDFTPHRGTIDILSGGFPCQPYSSAGKRLGKKDDRHLWPEMLRAIREIRPTWVVGENVYGLVNWNGGLVFEEVQADLEAEGYTCQPVVIPACAVNAPHRRDRVWFVAYANECAERSSRTSGKTKSHRSENYDEPSSRRESPELCTRCSDVLWTYSHTTSQRLEGSKRSVLQGGSYGFTFISKGNASNSERFGQSRQGRTEQQSDKRQNREWKAGWSYDDGRWPTQSPICSGDDGLSSRLAGITFPKFRQESLKAYGNAVVPQVVYQIFKTIEAYEKEQLKIPSITSKKK